VSRAKEKPITASTQPVFRPALAAVTLFAESLEETKDFYVDGLGLEVTFEDPHSVVFRFGETLLNFLDVSEAPELIEPADVATGEHGSRFMFTVAVEDVDATCGELQTRGIDLLNGPMDRPWGPRTACFADPSGHVWEIAS
jgi:catechol 2,3-dioxygenase-like lactoylglutathione lyase family enzyme